MTPKKSSARPKTPMIVRKGNLWFGIAMLITGFLVGTQWNTQRNLTGLLAIPQGNTEEQASASSAASEASSESQEVILPTVEDMAALDKLIPSVDPARDHVRSSGGSADVAVIEYIDLECPFCKRVHPTLQELAAKDSGVVWIMRHFPLAPHPNAQKAAEATECASRIGGEEKFWAMVDAIIEKGADYAKLPELAQELGLDATALSTCLSGSETMSRVLEDLAMAERAKVNGTPTSFVVNLKTGRIARILGAQPLETFQAAVNTVRGSGE